MPRIASTPRLLWRHDASRAFALARDAASSSSPASSSLGLFRVKRLPPSLHPSDPLISEWAAKMDVVNQVRLWGWKLSISLFIFLLCARLVVFHLARFFPFCRAQKSRHFTHKSSDHKLGMFCFLRDRNSKWCVHRRKKRSVKARRSSM